MDIIKIYKIISLLLLFLISDLYSKDLDFYDKSYAVIIGINNYQSEKLQDLNYAVEDAQSIADLLNNKLDFKEENIYLILNENATKINIEDTLYNIIIKAGDNDRILVFYAGHGETVDLKSGGTIGYLIPVDGNPDRLFTSGLSMSDFKEFTDMTAAKHVLYLIDACYGGIMTANTRSLQRNNFDDNVKFLNRITNEPARQIITAGGKGETSIEKSIWGHSAFTKELLSGIGDGLADDSRDPDGYITADELGSFLSKNVFITSEENQTPSKGRYGSGSGEFVFINPAYVEDAFEKEEETLEVEAKSNVSNDNELLRGISELRNQIRLIGSSNTSSQNSISTFDKGDKYLDSLFAGPFAHTYIEEIFETDDDETIRDIQKFSKKYINPYFDYKTFRIATFPYQIFLFNHTRVSGLTTGPQFEISQLKPMAVKLEYFPTYSFGLKEVFHYIQFTRYTWGNKKHETKIIYIDGINNNDDWFRHGFFNSISSSTLGKDYQDHYRIKGFELISNYQFTDKISLSTKYSSSRQSYLNTIRKYKSSIFKKATHENRPNFGGPSSFQDGQHVSLETMLSVNGLSTFNKKIFTHIVTISDSVEIQIPDVYLVAESAGWPNSRYKMKVVNEITPEVLIQKIKSQSSIIKKFAGLTKRISNSKDLTLDVFKLSSRTEGVAIGKNPKALHCDAGYVDDCSGDGDCCPESWIGDGFADCKDQPYGCDLSCYENDSGDCGGGGTTGGGSEDCEDCEYDFTPYGSECCDTAWDEYGIDCATLESNYAWDCSGCECPGDSDSTDGGTHGSGGCDAGYVDDCSDDGDCCPDSWIGDGFADCEDQAWGCDLTCYDIDGGDCEGGGGTGGSGKIDSLNATIKEFTYEISIKLPSGTHAYRYLIDKTNFQLDNLAEQAINSDGNAVSTTTVLTPYRFDIGYEFADTSLGGDFSYERVTFNYSTSKTLSRVDALAFRLIGGWSKKYLPVQKLFYVGGEGSVRGFSYMDTKKFSGNQMLLAKLEYHFTYFPYFEETFLFCDAAVIGNKFDYNHPVTSYGIGITLGDILEIENNDYEQSFFSMGSLNLYRTVDSNDGNWGIELLYNYSLNLSKVDFNILP